MVREIDGVVGTAEAKLICLRSIRPEQTCQGAHQQRRGQARAPMPGSTRLLHLRLLGTQGHSLWMHAGMLYHGESSLVGAGGAGFHGVSRLLGSCSPQTPLLSLGIGISGTCLERVECVPLHAAVQALREAG